MTKQKKKIRFTIVFVLLCVIIVCAILFAPKKTYQKIESLEDLSGKKICILTGSIFDSVIKEYIDNPQLYYGNSEPNNAVMLDKGKVSGYVTDEPLARYAQNEYPDFRILTKLTQNEYAYIFNKESAKAQMLQQQMNEFLAKRKADGTMEAIEAVWFGNDERAQTVDVPKSGVNGMITLGVASIAGAPFVYVKDGEYVGYDIDVAAHFCKEYGYGLQIKDYDFTGLLAAVETNKGVDFAASCITVTDERKEKVLFSDANYTGGIVVVVNDKDMSSQVQTFSEFIDEKVNNFYETFVVENRWKLFCEGFGNTMLITLLAIVFGTLLGFGVFWLSRETGKIFNFFVSLFSELIKGMPIVVLLMVLYYVVLEKSSLSNIAVAVIGFSLVFGASVLNMLKMSADTVSYAQTEASLSLGFSRTQTFLKVVLPQALRHFLPSFQSEVVSLIKATAVVGYLAVQDLTKMSDIVRGRTYEAFFPLIVTAIIYFLIEFLLVSIVKAIRVNTDPKRRSIDKILKGVNVK